MLLGCIADDLTGATDLALMLTRAGMRTVQVMGVPGADTDLDGFDAVVVALKSRTNPVDEAVAWSLAVGRCAAGAGRASAVLQVLLDVRFDRRGQHRPGGGGAARASSAASIALANPAFPTNKRTVYMGNLFVGDVPLAESPMKDHPLTPMRDSNLVRVLQRQTKLPVGLVPYRGGRARRGGDRSRLRGGSSARGERFVIVDAITRSAPRRHRQGGGRHEADHRRLRRRDGTAAEFHPTRV